MCTEPVEIHILPDGQRFRVLPGKTLLLGLAEKGFLIPSDCGGKGLCGKCLVQIQGSEAGRLAPPDGSERDHLGPNLLQAGYRLACRITVTTALTIRLPSETAFQATGPARKPTLLDESYYQSADPPACPGVAVDLGTTTIGIYLCDLETQRIVLSTALRNPQGIYGADVMSRISAAHSSATRHRLHEIAINAIETGTLSLCQATHTRPDAIGEMTVVGNPTMIHLLLDEDPTAIGYYPFKPRFVQAHQAAAGKLGFKTLSSASVYTLPLVSGFVGSDAIAAALAAELTPDTPGTLLVDVGTNGEILLTDAHGLTAASCATGPAFEGAAIRHGMAAVTGAIEDVKIDPHEQKVAISTIHSALHGSPKPAGLCGSGVVSAIAEMLRSNILLPDGRFNRQAAFPQLKIAADGGVSFELVPPHKSFTGRGLVLTQKDIRAIQLAKGALKAGIDLLDRQAGRAAPQRILIAGAFGNHIRPRDALTIGLFPRLALNQVSAVGNAAGSGAVLALLDPQLRRRAEQLAERITVVDLVHHPDFEETFLKALAFPEPA